MSRDFEDLGGADPYELLRVPPDADAADIKRAHRHLVQTAHTDRGGDREAMSRINLARDVLLDPARRTEIERRLRRLRSEGDTITREASAKSRPPQARPPGHQSGWTYGAGPDPAQAKRAPHPAPEPEPQAAPHKDPFAWTYGADPSTPRAQRPRRPAPQRRWADPPAPNQWQRDTQAASRRPVYQQPGRGDPGRRRWNRLALTALVVSLIFWPVGLLLAVAAVVQARLRNERGAGLVWIAIGWSILILLVIAGLI